MSGREALLQAILATRPPGALPRLMAAGTCGTTLDAWLRVKHVLRRSSGFSTC